MACEETDLYRRWQFLDQIAKGEMPEGMTEADLRAMDLPLPGEVEIVEQPDGTVVMQLKTPAPPAKRQPNAGAFACDAPE